MNTSTVKIALPNIDSVQTTRDTLRVELSDGRTLAIPLAWYPRLLAASANERKNWRLIGKGQGIHWEDLDEDISIESLLAGRPSMESQQSLEKWLKKRNI
ncbi:MAG: hypothetical protein CL946_13400 [Ectothiorhodospiraceae bacterium]|nr:hypothetical protein [Ectothiorhodospiraceae bacterium]